jgi:hypothetical protein
MNGRVKVVRKRTFSAHHMLIGAARAAVDDAEAKRPGWSYIQLAAITLCGLAIEAICNAVGDRVVTDWKDFESANSNAKLRLLCERLNVQYDKNQEPWSTVRWLLKQRNAIAHAKPQRVEEEHVWSRDDYDRRQDYPLSNLERQLTLDNAKRSLKATEDVLLRLTEVVPAEDSIGLYSDAWEGSASAMDDDYPNH